VSPSIARVSLGDIAVFTCYTDREALWFIDDNETVSDNVNTTGKLSQYLEIQEIHLENIGNYCCYGHEETNGITFLACSILALLGTW